MTSHSSANTHWLLNFPEDMRIHMANVYIEAMEEDIALLKESLQVESSETASTLPIVHKIKGGAMQIGLNSISRSAAVTEKLGKLASPAYSKALSVFVTDVEQSITDVTDWKNINNRVDRY